MVLSLRRAALPLAAALALAGCATRGGDVPYNPVGFTAPDAPPPAASFSEYKLSPGDVVTVRVYELETLSGDQVVDERGRVNLPLIGAVPADGQTIAQFENEVATRLRKDYLQNPHVAATLKTAASRTVTVDGAVKQPGVYAIAPSTTLIQTVALARGTSNDANLRRVVIFRQIGGERRAGAFDLMTIRNGKDPDPAVYPSDVIVVDGSSLTTGYRSLLRSIPLVGLLARF